MSKNLKFDAWKQLLQRYRDVFRAAWDVREQLEPQPRLKHESAFLPAALELVETPPSPIPRLTAKVLMALFVIILIWAIFGKIDIVAVAHGKIVPNDRVKVIQPLQPSKVKRILVHEGQQVQAGELLVELDATESRADNVRTAQSLEDVTLATLRANAILKALEKGGQPRIAPQPGISSAAIDKEQSMARSQYSEYLAKLAVIDADLSKRQAELQSNRELIAKLEQTLPIAKQRAEDYLRLHEQNFMSKHGYMEREQERIERERDLAAAKSRSQELQAAITENQAQRHSLVAEFNKTLLTERSNAEQKVAELQQELIKTGNREDLTRLTASVSGTVQQLAIHTVGGVVTEAQQLMVIVPTDNPLEVEAWVENKDIGFVYPKQSATVKIETFPYTKYGTLNGTVLTVSNDALNDEKKGLIYHARVLLDRTKIKVEDKQVNLGPGMAVTVEIKTGKRRVIDYFLSPLREYADESLRER